MFLVYKTFAQTKSWRFKMSAVIGLSKFAGNIS